MTVAFRRGRLRLRPSVLWFAQNVAKRPRQGVRTPRGLLHELRTAAMPNRVSRRLHAVSGSAVRGGDAGYTVRMNEGEYRFQLERDVAEAHLLQATRRLVTLFPRRVGHRDWSDPLSPEMGEVSATKTLTELTGEEYEDLAWHASCFCLEDREALQYFLPWLLSELAYGHPRVDDPTFRYSPFDSWKTVTWMVQADWHRFKPHQVEALLTWFDLWWEATLQTPVPVLAEPRNAHHLLELFAFLELSLPQRLSAWIDRKESTAIDQLLACAGELVAKGLIREGPYSGLEIPATARSCVRDWLFSKRLMARLEDLVETHPDEHLRIKALAVSIGILEAADLPDKW